MQKRKQRPVTVMEVCGTHTMAIARYGLRALFPVDVRLVSGPGCPVCVTPLEDIDRAVALAERGDITVTTFGDMLRVPGSAGSLEHARAGGADVRVVYSPADALDIARQRPDRPVVFIGVGFETTAPAIAATLVAARRERVRNYFVLPLCKTIPAALRTLLAGPSNIDGFLLPGHVSAIIGADAYGFLPAAYGIPGVISGFSAAGIVRAVTRIAELARAGTPRIENGYQQVVTPEGNRAAQAMLASVFVPSDARWRAVGVIPGTGLSLSSAYRSFDASTAFPVRLPVAREPRGCRCGDVLLGRIQPQQCRLFGTRCTPGTPVGPCMVSSEGSCAAAYRYGTVRRGGNA